MYKQHIVFSESAYKQGVRVYKDILIIIDYQIVKSLCEQMELAK
jgi:hypothetical protein